MAECELIATCIFFNEEMANLPHTAEIMKLDYCKGHYTTCARYRVFKALGRENVPKDLFPNDINKADKILSSSS